MPKKEGGQDTQEKQATTGYNVYINLRLVASVKTEEEAWSVIGLYSIFAIYDVRDKKGNVRSEFIPY